MIKKTKNSLRIISGKWRRRLIYFPDIPSLRPTHDRIRETLFNWLSPFIKNAVCLDLFSGSGALGFEALSRDAKKVVFLDREPSVVTCIKESAQTLRLDKNQYEAIVGSFPNQLSGLPGHAYDIIFIDPPYNQGIVIPCLDWLSESGYLTQSALVYVESERELMMTLSPTWEIYKEGHTKKIAYRLLRRIF